MKTKYYVTIIFICLVHLFFFLIQPGMTADRFTDNGDGTVTDHVNNLMWAETDNQGDIFWKEAETWVKYTFKILEGKGHTNWRIPTLQELESL